MRRKNKSAGHGQHSSPQPLGVEHMACRVSVINRLDLQLIAWLKSPADSLEPAGPLAGKQLDRPVGPGQNQSLEIND